MLAISNLARDRRHELPPWNLQKILRPFLILASALLLVLSTCPVLAAESPTERAKRLYQEAQKASEQRPDDVTNAWHLARACFDCAEFAVTASERANYAEQGIGSCRRSLSQHPNSGPTHYYLALNLGQLAQTKSLGALRLVEEMERELKAAIRLTPTFDYAGPHRSLGLLYTEAPGWPISVGDRSAAFQHLAKAVELSPEYPDNQLSLLEACLKWDNRTRGKSLLNAAAKQIQAAKELLKGEQWEPSWLDWDRRWAKVLKKLG